MAFGVSCGTAPVLPVSTFSTPARGTNVRTLRPRRGIAALVALMSSVVVFTANADDCGQLGHRPIRWIVPYSPGGGFDVESRVLAPHLARTLGTDVAVDNVSGAGGLVGAKAIRDAAADGHTIGVVNGSGLAAVSVLGEQDAPTFGRVHDPRPLGHAASCLDGQPRVAAPHRRRADRPCQSRQAGLRRDRTRRRFLPVDRAGRVAARFRAQHRGRISRQCRAEGRGASRRGRRDQRHVRVVDRHAGDARATADPAIQRRADQRRSAARGCSVHGRPHWHGRVARIGSRRRCRGRGGAGKPASRRSRAWGASWWRPRACRRPSRPA